MPNHVSRHEHEAYYRPCGYFISCSSYNRHTIVIQSRCAAGITRVGSFIKNWLNDIISSIKGLIPDKLDGNRAIGFLNHCENGHILVLPWTDSNLEHYKMHIAIYVIYNTYVIHITVTVEVKVIDP
jgi:hypothetical protein